MNPISKRVKSALMTLVSLFISALVVAVSRPEFFSLITDIETWAKAIGIPSSIVIFAGVVISEAWKAWVNSRKLNQALKAGKGSSQSISHQLY